MDLTKCWVLSKKHNKYNSIQISIPSVTFHERRFAPSIPLMLSEKTQLSNKCLGKKNNF